MHNNSKFVGKAVLITAGILAAVEPAVAQIALEEVVVTARKREESLQDTPLSIKALTAQELEQRNVTTLGDMQQAVPNLAINSGISRNNAGIFIRGIGQSDRSITLDPGVGTYVDGVYLARLQGGMLDLLDIERIEVLRGPQGTLYGRNTIGGAVNFIQAKPSEEAGLKVKVGAGNYNLMTASLIADLPLIENKLLSRFSVGYTDRDGFTENVFTGDEWDDKNFLGARADLRWLASDALTVDLSLDWAKRRQESNGAQCVVENPTAPLMLFADFVAGIGYQQACARSQNLDELEFSLDNPSRDDTDEWGTALTVNWDFSENVTFKSITAFRHLEWALYEDFDGSDRAIFSSRGEGSEQEQISQEFQLSGSALDDTLTWSTGLYAFKEDVERPAFSDFFLFGEFSERIREAETESYAVYGQATYDFVADWSLTAGLRYTYEDRSFDNREIDLLTGTLSDVVSVSDDFDSITPMLNLAWRPTGDLMLYLSWAQGFKSGGFNARPVEGEPESLEPYDEETVDSYEFGVKSSWLDHRLTLNAALFRSEYDDMQLNTVGVTPDGDALSIIRNAGESVIQGVEIEFEALLTENWRISGGYGYTDAEYKEFENEIPDASAPNGKRVIDLSNRDFANTPRNTFNLSSEWTLPIRTAWLDETLFRIDYSHADSTFNDIENTESVKRESTDIFNASLIFSLNEGNTQIQLWGKNLTDEIYYRAGFTLGDSFGTAQRFFSEPRTYGVTLSHQF